EWPLEAAGLQAVHHLGERLLHFAPVGSRAAAHRHGRERLIVEAQVDPGGIDAACFDEVGEALAGIAAPEYGMDRDRYPGVQDDAVEQSLHRLRCCIG